MLPLDVHSTILYNLYNLEDKIVYINYLIELGYEQFVLYYIHMDPTCYPLFDKCSNYDSPVDVIKYYATLFQLENVQDKTIYFERMIKKGYSMLVIDSIRNDKQFVYMFNKRMKHDALVSIIMHSCRYVIKLLWKHDMLDKHIYGIILYHGNIRLAEYCFYGLQMFVEDSVIITAARYNCMSIFSYLYSQVSSQLLIIALQNAIYNSSINIIRFYYENYEDTMEVIKAILNYGSINIFKNIGISDPMIYINPDTIDIIIKKGYINELAIYISKYEYLDLKETTQIAIINHHLDIIIYIHTIFGDFFTTEHINMTIRSGCKAILIWLLNNTNAEFKEENIQDIYFYGREYMLDDIIGALERRNYSRKMGNSLFGKFKLDKPSKKRKESDFVIRIPTKNTKRFI